MEKQANSMMKYLHGTEKLCTFAALKKKEKCY